MTWLQDRWKNLPFNRLDFERDYVVDQVLSRKPRSSVLLVRHQGGSRQTVMKLTDPAATNPLEKQCLSSLRHPGIAKLIGYGFTRDRRVWMETEYIDGVAFSTWLDDPVSEDRPANGLQLESKFFLQLLSAVQYLHCCGWLHGDLSPQNILVSPSQRGAVLIDFEHTNLIKAIPKTTLPRRHSLAFASPHEIAGGRTTEACEQYSLGKLGMLLFGLVDGELTGESTGGMATILQRATSERPKDRFPDLQALEREIRANSRSAVEL